MNRCDDHFFIYTKMESTSPRVIYWSKVQWHYDINDQMDFFITAIFNYTPRDLFQTFPQKDYRPPFSVEGEEWLLHQITVTSPSPDIVYDTSHVLVYPNEPRISVTRCDCKLIVHRHINYGLPINERHIYCIDCHSKKNMYCSMKIIWKLK